MSKQITAEEQKRLLQLWENSKSGNDDEIDAYENYREELGIHPDEVQAYLAVKQVPQTEQEKRLANKGKAADEKRSRDALPVEKVAEAYGVNLKKAEEDGELVGGGLQKYLDSRYVMARMPGESRKDYVDRNRNAFEPLGLNWDNAEDRALVARSLHLAELQDGRNAIAEDMNGGIGGTVMNMVLPRTMEHATRDVQNGEDTDGYALDFLLDGAENALQAEAAPVSAPAGALSKYLKASKAYKNFKKGKKVFDGRTKANKAMNGLGKYAEVAGNAAAVPFVMEAADAAVYDDPENSRSEFSGDDVVTGAAVNMITPVILKSKMRRGSRVAGEDAGELSKASHDIANAVNADGLKKYLVPWGVNKAGKTSSAQYVPFAGDIAKERDAELKQEKAKSDTKRTKHEKWALGFSIPFPGDRDYEEYTEWKNRKISGLAKYLKED